MGYKYLIQGPVYLNGIIKHSAGEYVPVYYDQVSDPEVAEILDKPDKHSHCFLLEGAWPFGKHFEASAGLDLRYVINASHNQGEKDFETIVKTGFLWHY